MREILTAIAILAAMSACSDIFVTDISGKQVAVVAPADKLEITEGKVSFRWNALNDADKYRVTIVSPDFNHVRFAIKDTLLYRDSLSMSFGFGLELPPANYQWSIQAFNEAYESVKSVYDLTVTPKPEPPEVPDTDISEKKVSIVAPVDDAAITEGKVPFRWNRLDGVAKYRVIVVSPDFEHARLAVKDTVIYQDSMSMSFGFELDLAPSDYQWCIQAFNDTYESVKAVYDLVVEPRGPIKPDIDISGKKVSIVAPVNNSEIPEGIIPFRWDALYGADKYRVIVVSPDFEHARLAVKDAVIYRDSLSMSFGFELDLVPADYQWSIQALNETYESVKSIYDLTIVPKPE